MVELKKLRFGRELLKKGFGKLQKGGVIMDVTNAEQARVAERSGALAVMALERVPSEIREQGGVARMADSNKIIEIMESVSIPVMAKCRIGHEAEARILEALEVDMIDESEVLTPADPFDHVNKKKFKTLFVCGARDLGEALRRINEGAAIIRTKGEAGTGNIIEAVRHQKTIIREIAELKKMSEKELKAKAREFRVGLELVKEVKFLHRLPVVNFAAGGVATPADATLMMLLGSDGVFVGSGIFKSENPEKRARAIVEAVTHYNKPEIIAKVSKGLGATMKGIEIGKLSEEQKLQRRGW